MNRERVKKFFAWEDPKWPLIGLGLATLLVGEAAWSNGWTIVGGTAFGLSGLLTLVATIGSNIMSSRYYRDVQTAKMIDFSTVLLRSFRKIETDIRNLLDFDAKDLDSIDFNSALVASGNDLEALYKKTVFLFGRRDGGHDLRFVRVNGRVSIEYSPIFVSILYLTKNELLVYFADVDIVHGDLKTEEINRLFLKNIVEVTSASSTERIKRADNEELFKKYEKITMAKVSDDIVLRQHTIRVTKTDGRNLSLLVGAPKYSATTTGILDGGDDDDDRYSRVSREIIKRINDAQVDA